MTTKGWRYQKLRDLTTKIGSGATPRGGSNSYKPSGISLIRSQNVLDLAFSNEGLAFIDDEQAMDLQNVTVGENDVLLNITGDSVARACKVPKQVLPARVNQHVAIIRPDAAKLDSDFLLYYLQLSKQHLLSISEIGGTRRALTKGMIEDLDVYAPDLTEQESIASVLRSLDDKIDLLHRQNATLEAMAETLFRQWFVEPNKRAEIKGIKASQFVDGTFAMWIAETVGGEWGKEAPEGDFVLQVNCIRGTDIADLNTGLPNRTPVRYVKERKFKAIEPREGDLIIEISGGTEDQSTGRTTYINADIKSLFQYPVIFSNFCRLLRIKRVEYTFFVYCYLQYLYNQDEFFNLENGSSGIKNLDYKTLLFDSVFAMPNADLVVLFNSKVEPLFKKINQNKKQVRTLTALRDTLLPKLMSGEVRVKECSPLAF